VSDTAEELTRAISEWSPSGCEGARVGRNGLAPGPLLIDHIRELAEFIASQFQVPPCDGGCNMNDGPAEDCSRHGRTVQDVWRMQQEALGRVHQLELQLAALRAGGSIPPPTTG
jgi:hypothetical protein